MIQNVVTKSIAGDGVIYVIILICIPVVCEFLGAKNKHRLVAVLVIFYNGKCGEGFTKTDTIGKDTAVVLFKFVNDSKNSVFLEVVEHTPNLAVLETCRFIGENIFGNVFKEFIENIIQGYEIYKIGRVLIISSCNIINYFISNFLE